MSMEMEADQTADDGAHRLPPSLPDRLPPRCLVGPDGATAEAVLRAMEAVDDAALVAYAQGVAALREIRRLLALQRQQAAWRRQRAFALARLRAYEQSRPDLVERALLQEESA